MTFLFPPDQNHPSSASRLFLFARYGPLVHGQIVGGSYKRHRPLTKQEQDDLIEQNEGEELLALFLDPSVSRTLSPTEQSAVLTETRSIPHVQHALFNYTTHEVRAFLRYLRSVNALPESADVPFGILALAIEQASHCAAPQTALRGQLGRPTTAYSWLAWGRAPRARGMRLSSPRRRSHEPCPPAVAWSVRRCVSYRLSTTSTTSASSSCSRRLSAPLHRPCTALCTAAPPLHRCTAPAPLPTPPLHRSLHRPCTPAAPLHRSLHRPCTAPAPPPKGPDPAPADPAGARLACRQEDAWHAAAARRALQAHRHGTASWPAARGARGTLSPRA